MTLNALTGKKLRVNIKHGWTIDDFCRKFECSTDELIARINQIYTIHETAKQIINDLEANEKKPRKAAAEIMEEKVVEENTPQQTTDSETIEAKAMEATSTLGELREAEKTQSDLVINIEKEHSELASKRHELKKSFQRIREELIEIRMAFEAKGHEAEAIVQKDNALVVQMNEIVSVYREERAKLEMIRTRIEEESKIVISVYQNGEISLFEGSEATLDESGHEEIFEILREREEAEDFRPRDLRVVARLIKIVNRLTVPFDIIFENEEVELGYELFKKIK